MIRLNPQPKIFCWGLLVMSVITGALVGRHPFLLGAAMVSNAGDEPDDPRFPREPGGQADTSSTPENESSTAGVQESDQPLLGELAAEKGESRRNENVQFNLVDNNSLKELNIRLGTTATIVEEFRVNQGYFGTEFGNSPTPVIHARPATGSKIHGDLFWDHNNSVFSARSFFQVGGVRPARENMYGVSLMLPVWEDSFLTLEGSQNKIRGNVNGNVLIPLPEERKPLTDDPELAAIIQNLLSAYPAGPPNRQDIAERAHNTNSLQWINTDVASAQLDQQINDRDKLLFRYALTSQNVDAFQFVTGQNPDTDNRSHRDRVTWIRTWSAATITESSLGFDRLWGACFFPQLTRSDLCTSPRHWRHWVRPP